MSVFAEKILSSVKLTLRQIHTNEFDVEISSYIDTCATDLHNAGILSFYFDASRLDWEVDAQILQAVRWYCLSVFGLYNSDMEKYAKAYQSLKSTLATQNKYTKDFSQGVDDQFQRAIKEIVQAMLDDSLSIFAGGTAGQFLVKQSDKDKDFAWADLSLPEVDLSGYQTKQDDELNTSDKTVVGAINFLHNDLSLRIIPRIDYHTDQLRNHEIRISNIEEHISDDYFVTDDSVAYSKAVPVRACSSAKLLSLGGMTYKCKSLLPYPWFEGSPTRGGVTFTMSPEGLVLNGTSTQTYYTFADKSIPLTANKTYTLSGCPADGGYSKYYLYVTEADGTKHFDLGTGITFTTAASGNASISMVIAKDAVANNTVFKPMLNEGSTALPYEPYYEGLRDSKVTEIKSNGANWLKSVTPAVNTTVENGVVTQVTADSRTEFNCKVIGFKDATYVKNVATSDGTPKLGIVAMSFTKTSDFDTLRFGVNGSQRDTLATFDASHLVDGKTYTLSFNMTNITQGSISWCDMMLNEGSTAVPYKPYREEPISSPIPAEIQALEGYGKDGFNIDLEKQEYTYGGVTSALPVRLNPIIEVEGGGSLEFVNEYKNPVPSAVKYLLKEESAV